jgi:hypothetical protein
MLRAKLPQFNMDLRALERRLAMQTKVDGEGLNDLVEEDIDVPDTSSVARTELERGLKRQREALENFEKSEKDHAAFNYFSRAKVGNATNVDEAVEAYRCRVESRQLCDLGTDMIEKYGPDTSWKMGLRSNLRSAKSRDVRQSYRSVAKD